MEEIENNPFRVLGVVSNATSKDIQREKIRISRYSSVGKSINVLFDNVFVNKIERNEKTVNKAFSDIEQREVKLEYSIFWFVNLNPFDEISISHIENNNVKKALETWDKVTEDREITPRIISCLNNLSTLQMVSSNSDDIKKGINNKLRIINSPNFRYLISNIVDETFKIDEDTFFKKTIMNIANSYLKNNDDIFVFSLFECCSYDVKKIVAKELSKKYIYQIELIIKEAQENCKKDPINGDFYAKKLYEKSNVLLIKLTSFISKDSNEYKYSSNSVAEEIMNCDLLYFNKNLHLKDVEHKSLELLKLALTLASNKKTNIKIENDIKEMESRISKSRISKYYDAVYEEFENFKDGFVNIDSVNIGISNSKPKLDDLKRIDGSSDDYLQTSSITVSILLSGIIKECNKVQDNNSSLAVVKSVFQKSVNAMYILTDFDMDTEIRSRFDKNWSTIREMNRQVQLKKEGCYIATMAYGDYDHPQVVILREFRDNVLMKTIIGRLFVRKYYKYSPLLVNKLKHSRKINKFVRLCLDVFIKRLKK